MPPMVNGLVSVIVPTRDRLGMLSDALASIAVQTYRDVEVIVINDAGTPPPVAVPGLERLRVIHHQERLGTGAARNSGLAAASGEFIAYLDDDDWYLPDHLALLVAELQRRSDCTAAYAIAKEVTRRALPSGGWERVSERIVYQEPFNRTRMMIANYIPNLCLVHRRDVLARTGLFDANLTVLEDWDFHIRLALSGEFSFVPTVTAEYTLDAGRAHRNQRDARWPLTVRYILDRYAPQMPPLVRAMQRRAWPGCFSPALNAVMQRRAGLQVPTSAPPQ